MLVKIEVNNDDESWRARGIGEDIFRQGQTADKLYANIKEAVALHFENGKPSKKNEEISHRHRAHRQRLFQPFPGLDSLRTDRKNS
jgi:hypothetical protein